METEAHGWPFVGLAYVYRILFRNLHPALFFFPKPCNHSLLHPCGSLSFLFVLRGCQETLPGVRPLWYITRGEVAVSKRPRRRLKVGPALGGSNRAFR